MVLFLDGILHWVVSDVLREDDSSFRRNLRNTVLIKVTGCRCFNLFEVSVKIIRRLTVYPFLLKLLQTIPNTMCVVHFELLLRLSYTWQYMWSILLAPEIRRFEASRRAFNIARFIPSLLTRWIRWRIFCCWLLRTIIRSRWSKLKFIRIIL